MCRDVIPQFPLKKTADTNHAYRVDFLALSKDLKTAFLVELKTDMGSKSKDQEKYLEEARNKGLAYILSELIGIASNSDSRKKYVHLLVALSNLGILILPCQLITAMSKRKPRYSENLVNKVKVSLSTCTKIEVVVIQPKPEEKTERKDFRYIYFDQVADIIEEEGELGELFACYLRKWTTDPGNRPANKPQCFNSTE